MEENKITAIYAIKDIRENKVIYIGLSTDYVQRRYCHFHSKQTSIDMYMFNEGRENFDMYIIEKIDEDCDLSDLRNKEQYYIEKYNTIEEGFNKQCSGNVSADWKKYMREYQKSDKQREYQREYMREYCKTDKCKEHKREYKREYRKSDKQKEYHREYMREYSKEYEKTDKRKEYKKEYMREYYQKKKLENRDNE